jgi:hypothetical protein
MESDSLIANIEEELNETKAMILRVKDDQEVKVELERTLKDGEKLHNFELASSVHKSMN